MSAAQSTAFTYQGSLDDGGAPASGLHDFRFRLFSVASGGTPIGSTLCVDNVSVVVRHTLVQMLTPDEKRGRVSAVNSLFIGTSNELGGFESGTVAHWFGPVFSVVSGGVGTILVVIAVALIWPQIRNYGRLDGP